jgi:hypothetical protein
MKQTVREALDEKREQLDGKVAILFLNCFELFYKLTDGTDVEDSVYPVSRERAAQEAKYFGCEWEEI